MKNTLELQQVIYNVFKTQIQFGTYRFEERLPTIEEAAPLFQTSVKTIRTVYQQLAQDGYLTISKSIGVKVSVQYTDEDIEAYIQRFFAEREIALLDLSQSLRPLLSNAQWLGFKNLSSALLDKIEQFTIPREGLTPYIMIQQLQIVYGALGNDLLMRLVWQTFMFFLLPFLSVSGNLKSLYTESNPLLEMTSLSRQQNWPALHCSVEKFQGQKACALHNFYANRILLPPSEQQIVFEWSSYKKTSQIYYSLGMALLVAIVQGIYPPGSLLPSLDALAQEKQVSLNTVRRTFALLNNIGAAKSINGVGTQVLPAELIGEYCDLSQPTVRERLLDFTKSLHLLSLSCRQVAEITISSMNESAVENLEEQLKTCFQSQQQELVAYVIINQLSKDAPYATIRTIYTELFQQLFWGYPLQSMEQNPHHHLSFYLPYFDLFLDCLERSDAAGFSINLEKVMKHEIEFTIGQLIKLGIDDAAALVLDR